MVPFGYIVFPPQDTVCQKAVDESAVGYRWIFPAGVPVGQLFIAWIPAEILCPEYGK
jgi:hypothetical protein